MTEYPASWSENKRTRKALESARLLLPGETVLFQTSANSTKPLSTDVVITNVRVFTYISAQLGRSVNLRDIADVTTKPGSAMTSGSIALTDRFGAVLKFSAIRSAEVPVVADALSRARAVAPPPEALDAQEQIAEASAEAARTESLTPSQTWPSASIVKEPSKKAFAAIQRMCHPDESPWLIIAPGVSVGLLVAFDDRLAIIKTGGLTGFMAGSLGGERSTTFFFSDINAIEYNSGMVTGVLEVLTASYQGTANKDFWRGTNQSRNANSNDPFTLSNTLPLNKLEHQQWAPQIQELRARISASKRTVVQVGQTLQPLPVDTLDSLVEQLQKLASLRDAGVLTEQEFADSKARLIAGG